MSSDPKSVKFKPPSGKYSVSLGKLTLPPEGIAYPGQTYRVVVSTLCGSEEIESIEASPKSPMTIEELARRIQVVGSIQHVTRRACFGCRERYISDLSVDEKRWLYMTNPTLGPIFGVDIEEKKSPTALVDKSGRVSRRGE